MSACPWTSWLAASSSGSSGRIAAAPARVAPRAWSRAAPSVSLRFPRSRRRTQPCGLASVRTHSARSWSHSRLVTTQSPGCPAAASWVSSVLSAGCAQLPGHGAGRVLQGLHAVQDQQGAVGAEPIGERLALVGRVGGGGDRDTQSVDRRGEEVVLRRLPVIPGALAVEGPAVDLGGTAPAARLDPVQPAFHQRRLARPAGGDQLHHRDPGAGDPGGVERFKLRPAAEEVLGAGGEVAEVDARRLRGLAIGSAAGSQLVLGGVVGPTAAGRACAPGA